MKKNIMVFFLVVGILVSLFSGCTKENDPAAESTGEVKSTKEEVNSEATQAPAQEDKIADLLAKETELVMYMIGGPGGHHDEALDAINELAKKDLNLTLQTNYMSWGEWKTKYPLVLASKGDCDLIFSATWAFYSEHVSKKGFMPVDELVQEYAPALWEALPEAAWSANKVDGINYMIPTDCVEFETYGFLYRKDLADKYSIDKIESLDDMEEFLAAIKVGEPDMVPFHAGPQDVGLSELMYYQLKEEKLIPLYSEDYNLFIPLDSYNDPDVEVIVDEYEEGFLDLLKRMRRWQEAGYLTKNALANQINAKESMEANNSACAIVNFSNFDILSTKFEMNNEGWVIDFFPFTINKEKQLAINYGQGYSIPIYAENPEKAVMLMEKLMMDQTYYDLSLIGRKGIDFDVEDSYMVPMTDENGEVISGGLGGSAWGWTRDAMNYKDKTNTPQYQQVYDSYMQNYFVNPTVSFFPNIDSIQTELTAIYNVFDTYKTPLMVGAIEDVDAGYNELINQLKLAGYDTVIEELLGQYKEYVTTLN